MAIFYILPNFEKKVKILPKIRNIVTKSFGHRGKVGEFPWLDPDPWPKSTGSPALSNIVSAAACPAPQDQIEPATMVLIRDGNSEYAEHAR